MYHCSCVIPSEDGSTQSIIIIGGTTEDREVSNTSEILDLNGQKWVQGPALPLGVRYRACVTLPPTSNFSCVVFGSETGIKSSGEDIYGLDKRLMEWKLLGKFTTKRQNRFFTADFYIALPLSKVQV